MKRHVITMTTALTIIGAATTAQAGCADDHSSSTRFNPTELSDYQKCWLKEHKPEDTTGVLGTLFYVQATEEEFVSLPVSDLVRMGKEKGTEFITQKVMEVTSEELGGIVDSKEFEQHQQKIVGLTETQENLEVEYDNKLDMIATLEEQIAFANAESVRLTGQYNLLNRQYQYLGGLWGEELTAREEAEGLVNHYRLVASTAEGDNAHYVKLNEVLSADLAQANIDLNHADTSNVLYKNKIGDLEDDLDEQSTTLTTVEKENDALEAQLAAKEITVETQRELDRLSGKLASAEKMSEALVKVRDGLLQEKADLEFDLEVAKAQLQEAKDDAEDYVAALNDNLEELYDRWKGEEEIMVELGHGTHEYDDFADRTSRLWFIAERMQEIKDNKFQGHKFKDRPLGGVNNHKDWTFVGNYTVSGANEQVSFDLNDFFQDLRRPELTLRSADLRITYKDSNLDIELDNLWEVQTLNRLLREAVSATVERGLKHAAEMYNEGFRDGYEQGYAVGYVDGYRDAQDDFKQDDLD